MKKNNFKHSNFFFKEVIIISQSLDLSKIDDICENLIKLRKNKGRLFFIGVGGSAANASHAVNDFRKICKIESYSCFDNVSEMTARINDEGWDYSMVGWLKSSYFTKKDALFVFSVGGGDIKKNISVNIVNAIKYAKKSKSKIMGIVGNNGGYTKKYGDYIVQIPSFNNELVTPITESFQSLIWHLLVSNPKLQVNKTKW